MKEVLNMSTFEKFENGYLFLNGKKMNFSSVEWSPHAKFEGVALKHLITAKDTSGAFSYHLVRIEPQKKIGLHAHETQLETHEVVAGCGVCHTQGQVLNYEVGNIAILPATIEHEVIAGSTGLYLFAKFFPALC